MSLERLWAGWRSTYIQSALSDDDDGCVFCGILASGKPDEGIYVLWRGTHCFAILNAYPYTSGHLMLMPLRHVGELEELTPDETAELWAGVTDAVKAVKAAYSPGGINVGINLGRGAGAGVPGHLHVHCLPRWGADTNFMTSIAEARVLPEALPDTYRRLHAAWPSRQS